MSKRKKTHMQKKFKKDSFFKNKQIVKVSNGEKMSEVILRFIEPYKETASTLEAFEKLIALAIVAWNVHILKDKEIIGKLKESMQLGEEEKEDLNQILIAMMLRKELFFADNQRLILDCQVTETNDDFHLQVISTPDKTDENIKK